MGEKKWQRTRVPKDIEAGLITQKAHSFQSTSQRCIRSKSASSASAQTDVSLQFCRMQLLSSRSVVQVVDKGN
jgi:hypothetical protein